MKFSLHPPDLDSSEKKRLHRLTQEHPQQISNFKQLAQLLKDDRQYSSAAAILKKGLKCHPGDLHLSLHLAKTYHAAGHTKYAIALYTLLIHKHPEDPLAYEKIDKTYCDCKNYEAAAKIYRLIKKGNPLKEKSYARLHLLLVEKLKDFKKGIANLEGAIKEFGPTHRRLKDLGRLYAKKGNWKKAASCYARALKLKSDDADLNGLLGWAHVESGEFQKAEQYFKQVQHTFQGRISLGELALRLGRLDEAEKFIVSLEQQYRGNSRVATARSELTLKRGDAAMAYSQCEEILPRIPSYFAFELAHAHEVIAAACKKIGETDTAMHHQQMAAALKKGPDAYTALITLAEKKIEDGKLNEAEAVIERILQRYPGNTRAILNQAEIYLLRKKPKSAAAAAESALKSKHTRYKDEQLRGHSLLSRAYRLLKNSAEAKHHQELAKELQNESTVKD